MNVVSTIHIYNYLVLKYVTVILMILIISHETVIL